MMTETGRAVAVVAASSRARGAWRILIEESLAKLGGRATLPDLYREVELRRPTANLHWRAKVRQTLGLYFVRVGDGRWAAAHPTVSVDEYVASMNAWINRAVSRTVRRGHPLLSREDLLQEARIKLVQVYRTYGGTVPEGELRRIGTRSVVYGSINLHEASMKGRRRAGKVVREVSLDDGLSVLAVASDLITPLDRAEIRQVLERSVDDDVLRAVRSRVNPRDVRPACRLPAKEVRRIFSRAKVTVDRALEENGYTGGRRKEMRARATETSA